jgi:hypothetical protein
MRTGSGIVSRPSWLGLRTYEIALQPRWHGVLYCLVVLGIVALMGGEAFRTAYIAWLSDSLSEPKLRQAIADDPANPDLYHRLGMVLCGSLGEANQAEGLKYLKRATELNPRVPVYWSDLAWVCEMAGDTGCAIRAVENSAKLSPNTPKYHWIAANALLRLGQTDSALAEFRELLKLDPTYGPATFHLCLASLQDPQLIEDKVLPGGKDPSLRLAYLDFLSTNALLDRAGNLWRSIVDSGSSFPASSAMSYIENLLQAGRADDAWAAWRDLEVKGMIPALGQGIDNLVFNGDFERKPLNAGFDWRNQGAPYIALDFADTVAHSGKHCLRVDFTVSRNEDYLLLYQLIKVIPGRTYVLTAYVRSLDITSDSGPRLQAMDPLHPQRPAVESETTVGTTPWHPITLRFCSEPDEKLVRLALVRPRGRTFPTEITGSFWLDSVVLKVRDSEPSEPSKVPNPETSGLHR